jgi:hypothetical protein
VVGSCKYGDEFSGSGATELVNLLCLEATVNSTLLVYLPWK